MKEAPATFADELLRRVRAAADPEAATAVRVFRAVEQRVGGLDPVEHGDGGGGAAPVLPKANAHPSGVGVQSPRSLKAFDGAGIRQAAGKLARWVVFGLATGSVGYLWGHSTRDPSALDDV